MNGSGTVADASSPVSVSAVAASWNAPCSTEQTYPNASVDGPSVKSRVVVFCFTSTCFASTSQPDADAVAA